MLLLLVLVLLVVVMAVSFVAAAGAVAAFQGCMSVFAIVSIASCQGLLKQNTLVPSDGIFPS